MMRTAIHLHRHASAGVTARVEGGLTYTQIFDAENRLISVTVSGQTTQFIYDGDGNLVKKIKPDGSKTIYVAGIYEVDKTSGGAVTGTKPYYPVAGATLAPACTLALAGSARECRCASWEYTLLCAQRSLRLSECCDKFYGQYCGRR